MRLPAAFDKPQYLFRPAQIVRRARLASARADGDVITVPLAYGGRIRVRPRDAVGASIARSGVYELAVGEALVRLADPGELVVDAGANIGYMTVLAARRVGGAGRVIAIEPHPAVHEELRANVGLIQVSGDVGAVETINVAVSDAPRQADLHIPGEFDVNQGSASLESKAMHSVKRLPVAVDTLDRIVGSRASVGVLKLDVEGHELSVLRGAEQLLSGSRIRDILFEEHGLPPTAATEHLRQRGYALFRLDRRLLGPKLVSANSTIRAHRWDPPAFLATRHPERALARLRQPGWAVLARGPYPRPGRS